MELKNKALFVVEGKDDICKIKSLGVTFAVQTEGFIVPNKLLLFLKEAIKVRPIVLLLDPDGPGEKIRAKINKEIEGCINIKAEKKMSISHDKVGIAEADPSYLSESISELLKADRLSQEQPSLSVQDLVELGFIGPSSKGIKEKAIRVFNLPRTNLKGILEGLNILRIDKDKLREALI